MEQNIHTVFTKKYTLPARLNDYLSSSLLVVVDYLAIAFAALCASLRRDEIMLLLDERFNAWDSAQEKFKELWLLGLGFGMADGIHNVYLPSAFELTCFFFTMLYMYRWLWS